MADAHIPLSNFTSLVLRHQPEVIGLAVDAQGRASVDDLIAVDCAGMVARGHVFDRSDNGVWLTDAVPPAVLTPPGDS